MSEQKELRELYLKYHDGLVYFSMGYGLPAEDAQEVVNDVFIAVWEHRNRLEFNDKLRSYLFQSVKNRSLNHKRGQRPVFDDNEAFLHVGDSTDVSEELSARETEKLINRWIDELPERCRMIFLLSRKAGLPQKEIATLMELSLKTVENQIGIALKHLRRRLDGYEKGLRGNGFAFPDGKIFDRLWGVVLKTVYSWRKHFHHEGAIAIQSDSETPGRSVHQGGGSISEKLAAGESAEQKFICIHQTALSQPAARFRKVNQVFP